MFFPPGQAPQTRPLSSPTSSHLPLAAAAKRQKIYQRVQLGMQYYLELLFFFLLEDFERIFFLEGVTSTQIRGISYHDDAHLSEFKRLELFFGYTL
jgi:hypothetical protein